MKLLCSLFFVVSLLFFSACDDKATEATIKGRLVAGDGVELAELSEVSVYLHTSMGAFIGASVDSACCDDDLQFSFKGVAFGSYVLGIKGDYVLDPSGEIIQVDEDNAHENVSYTVNLPQE